MNNKTLALIVAFVALPLAGCTFPRHQGYNNPNQMNGNNQPQYNQNMPQYQQNTRAGVQVAPAPQAFVPPQSNAVQMMQSQTMSALSTMKERVRRVERAMIRLDRRMQLIEHNALSRMSPNDADETGKILNQSQHMQPMSHLGGQGSFYNGGGYQQTNSAVFQPVAYNPANNNKYVTSSLQAAPRNANASATQNVSAFPSLADKTTSAKDAPAVSIWTINYESQKIWPSREQLPGSRDVVEILRNSDQVTVFARGLHSASKEFRDRVRAISRYLGRVSGQKSVSIAAMPDDKMSGNVIEIIATK